MKQVKTIIALLIATALLYSCNPKDSKPAQVDPVKKEKKVKLTDALSSAEYAMLDEMVNAGNPAARGRKNKFVDEVTVAVTSATLTHGSGNSFSIDYGSMTNLLTMFFRGGDSTSASGNVYPVDVLQYSISINSWNATFTRSLYQSLVVTGSTAPDANGVIGTDWVFTYSNVVN